MAMLKNDELRAELAGALFWLRRGAGRAGLRRSLAARERRAGGDGPDGEVLTGSHWGAFRAKVEGGRCVAVTPWEKDPAPSHQLPGVMDSVYSPTRIKYPMVRRAFLEKGPGADGQPRHRRLRARHLGPGARSRRQRVQRVEKTYGPAATFAGSYGWKSPGRFTIARACCAG